MVVMLFYIDDDVDDDDSLQKGWTPMHLAAMNHDVRCADLLLAAGANINIASGPKRYRYEIEH